MNVRERAKTFEAFMSASSGSISSENELKRSQDEAQDECMTENSGSTISNGQKDSAGEKHKPVPPPRKARKKVSHRPDSPQLQRKTTPARPDSPQLQRKTTSTRPDSPHLQRKTTPARPDSPQPQRKTTPARPDSPQPQCKTTPARPDSPQLQRKTTPTRPDSPKRQRKTTPARSSPEVQPLQKSVPSKGLPDAQHKQPNEKPKAPRKPPPPRRGSYSKLPSPSLVSHIPHAKTKEFTPNNDTVNSVSNDNTAPTAKCRETPGSPKTAPKAHSRVPPTKPSRGSPRNSQNLTSSVPNKTSSSENKPSKDPHDNSSEAQRSPKANPKRPPPPTRTSSLTRKSRPPVAPKPKRPRRPATGPERRSATVPRTASVESKEAVTCSFLKESDDGKDLEKKARSLTSPFLANELKETEPRVQGDQPCMIENGAEETSEKDKNISCEETSQLKNVQNVETRQMNGIEENKTDDLVKAEISCKDATTELHKDEVSSDLVEPTISSKDDNIHENNKDSIKVENLETKDDKTIMNESDESIVHVHDYRSNEIESGIDENLETNLENRDLEKESCNDSDSMIMDENAKEGLGDLSICSEIQPDSPKTTEKVEDLVETSSRTDVELEEAESTDDVRQTNICSETRADSPKTTEKAEDLVEVSSVELEDTENTDDVRQTSICSETQPDSSKTNEDIENVVEISRRTDVQMQEGTENTDDVRQPMETDLDAELVNKELDNEIKPEKVDSEHETVTASCGNVTTICDDPSEVESERTEVEERPGTPDTDSGEQQVEEMSEDIVEKCSNEENLMSEIKSDVNEEQPHQEIEEVSSEEKDMTLNEVPEQPTQPDSAVDEVSSEPEERDASNVPSDISEVNAIHEKCPDEEKETGYLETSLDEEFFKEDEQNLTENTTEDQQPEDLTGRVLDGEEIPNRSVLNKPNETDLDASAEELMKDNTANGKACVVIQDASETTTENITEYEANIEQQSEEHSEGSEAERSPQRAACYENVVIVQAENDKEDVIDDGRSEPVRPSRPSRLKKQLQNSYENAAIIQAHTAMDAEVESSTPDNKAPKRTDVYENTVIMEANNDIFEQEESIETERESEPSVGENEKPVRPRYENVVFAYEEDPEDDSVYKVPRRKSFHSDSPPTSLVRSPRSASVGSMERKKRGGHKILQQTSKTEAEYVVPKPVATVSESEDTYVAPRSLRTTSTEETYVAPRSIRTASNKDDVYVAPRSIRATSTGDDVYVAPRTFKTSESDDMYVAPRSVRTSFPIDPEDVYAAPKSITTASSETTSESEYHVPTSINPSQTEEENGVYSVPLKRDSAVEQEDLMDEGSMLRRATRSSVLTSREQLPSSIKSVPAKPPRSSLEMSSQESENTKPAPIPRASLAELRQTPEPAPRASPRPKPRQIQDNSTSENVEKPEHEQAVIINEQSTASPKPKRPAPPRPKAPSIVSITEDSGENDSENKQKAPPRRPPPPLNRVSVLSADLGEAPSSPVSLVESSSESEDEQPPVPTGPPKKKTYHIAHEILSTERTFVNALTLCYEDCYGLIREADVVPESTLNDIFKDLGNIYHLDLKFLQELEERMKTWEETERIGDIVKKYGHFLKMYTTYINHYDKAVIVLQETMKENIQFAELVHQFQASEKCRNLSLLTFMLKPVQRIPSYRLLLKDYLKHLPLDSEEYRDTKVALDIVSEVASLINESMKQVDSLERVLRIQESIVGNAEIVKPGREFIKEGTLQKLCRKDMQDRTFFLLTDVLLYTSAVGGGQYKLKGMLPLLGIKVTLPDSPEFENEFNVISKTRSFTLSASTPAERDEWIEVLTKAISALTKKKSTFFKSKDGAGVTPGDGDEAWQLGDKAPVWIQDTRVTMCLLCTDKFTVTNRRHHCRGCGKVVCGSCSDNLAPLVYLDYAPARVCDACYDVLLKDQNKSIVEIDFDNPPTSPVSIGGDDLDRIHRKPAMFEILHRFKAGSKRTRKPKIVTIRSSVRTEVVGHDSESQMSGYLKFKRTSKHGWKRLWFVLKGNVLYTYKASEDIVALETIPILGYVVQEATRTEGDEIQFKLKHAGLPPINFKTETESSAFRWTQQLRKATTL